MLRFIVIALFQCLFLASGQVFLKLAMNRMGSFEWTWNYFKSLLLNWPLAACGVGFGSATILWFYMLKNFDFSLAYPITSLSYIFGMFAAAFIFHETVPTARWIGVVFIVIGVFFMVKQ